VLAQHINHVESDYITARVRNRNNKILMLE